MAHNSAAEVVRYCTEADEASRLSTACFQLEQARTRELWNTPQQRERLLDLLRKVEGEPGLIGASSHTLAIGRER